MAAMAAVAAAGAGTSTSDRGYAAVTAAALAASTIGASMAAEKTGCASMDIALPSCEGDPGAIAAAGTTQARDQDAAAPAGDPQAGSSRTHASSAIRASCAATRTACEASSWLSLSTASRAGSVQLRSLEPVPLVVHCRATSRMRWHTLSRSASEELGLSSRSAVLRLPGTGMAALLRSPSTGMTATTFGGSAPQIEQEHSSVCSTWNRRCPPCTTARPC